MSKVTKRASRVSKPEGVLARIALLPEIAIARVGSSSEPLVCYDWSRQPDNSGGGTGKTTLESRTTLRISSNGEIEEYEPEPTIPSPVSPLQSRLRRSPIEFTELVDSGRGQKFRPVCPWFVVFGQRQDGEWKLLLPQDLQAMGAEVSWRVVVANRKAYNMTLKFEDIIYAEAAIKSKGYQKADLIGRSDNDYWKKYSGFPKQKTGFDDRKRLIPRSERGFYLGRIEAPLSSDKYGVRLRFFPPVGAVYGPADLQEKIERLFAQLTPQARAYLLNDWDNWYRLHILGGDVKDKHCILNPESAWARKKVEAKQEVRTEPGPQFAHIALPKESDDATCHSLGLIDDFSDGIVTVELKVNKVVTHTAQARIVVGPPDLAPDRRHPTRLYDSVQDRAYLAGAEGDERPPAELDETELREEVVDMFRRGFETVGLTNIDAMNFRLKGDQYGGEFSTDMEKTAPGDLPLTQWGREKHRRLASLEALEDLLRERPHRTDLRPLFPEDARGKEQGNGKKNPKKPHPLINLPPDDETGQVPKENSFTRMPALMRGPQVAPLHLTKRQIEVLQRWIETLKKP